MGRLDLTYASYYGPRISQIMQTEGMEEVLEDIVYLFLFELSQFINIKEADKAQTRILARRILNQFKQMTLSSIAHCVYLIEGSTPPFDKKLYGFNSKDILEMFYQYLRLQKAWIDDKEKQAAESVSLAHRDKLLADAMNKSAEAKKMFYELSKKLSAKDKELSIYQTRTGQRR